MQRRNFLGALLGAAGVTAAAGKVTEAASSAAAKPAKVPKLSPPVPLLPAPEERSLAGKSLESLVEEVSETPGLSGGRELAKFVSSPSVRVTSLEMNCPADGFLTWDVTYESAWEGAPLSILDARERKCRGSWRAVSVSVEIQDDTNMVDVAYLGLPASRVHLPRDRRTVVRVKYVELPDAGRGECIPHSRKDWLRAQRGMLQ